MWEVTVVCSDPDCGEEWQLWISDLDEVDAEVCGCGHCVVLVRVAEFEPLVPAGR